MRKTTILWTLLTLVTASFIHGQTFSEKQLVTPNDDNVGETVFIDIDQDNDIDIVALSSTQLFWYENLGDQNFSNKILLDSGFGSSSALTVVDVDADGIEDILFIPRGTFVSAGSIEWVKNLGSGFFLSPQQFISGSFSRIEIGDFDNDGLDDIIEAELSGDIIYWSKNQGGGSYANPEIIYNPSGLNIRNYAITDLDEDTTKELTVTIDGSNEAAVLKFEMDPTNAITQTSLLSNSGNPHFFFTQLGDLDGDNKIDLAIRSSGCDIIWSKNFGSDIFANPISLGFSCSVEGQITDLGDIDRDGDLDLIFRESTGARNDIFWHTNDGNAAFTASLNNLSNDSINGNLGNVVFFDIDMDGDLDVFYTSEDEFGWFENTSETLSVDDQTFNQLTIFPNPAKNTLYIHTDTMIQKVAIYSLTGSLITTLESDQLSNNSVDISSLSKGMYLLNILTDNQQTVTHKIIKE